MRGLLITGTDTGVGKTLIAAGLARVLRERGINVGIMKPFAAARGRFSRKYRSEDTAILATASHSSDADREMNPFFYSVPAAPYVASAVTKQTKVSIPIALEAFHNLATRHDFLIVEGIGGIMVPLTETETFADFIRILNIPTIIVARCSLGTLNHILLTVKVSRAYGLDVMGLVMNGYPQQETAVDKRLVTSVKNLAGVDVLCVIPKVTKVKIIHFKLEETVVDNILQRLR
jgi:dethiobiotin synthetase